MTSSFAPVSSVPTSEGHDSSLAVSLGARLAVVSRAAQGLGLAVADRKVVAKLVWMCGLPKPVRLVFPDELDTLGQ